MAPGRAAVPDLCRGLRDRRRRPRHHPVDRGLPAVALGARAQGRTHFAEVHGPVADNALLLRAARASDAHGVRAGRWERFVWNVTRHPRLHAHPALADPAPWPADAFADATAPRAWWRTERQTFIPLPALQQAVFTIRVESRPLAQAIDSADKAARLHAAVASMSEAVLAYRGLDDGASAAAGLARIAHGVKTAPIVPARIEFAPDAPRAPDFGDVYHPRGAPGALAQARTSSSPATACPSAGADASASPCSKPASAWATTSSPPGPPGATTRSAASGWSSSRSRSIRRRRTTWRVPTPLRRCPRSPASWSRPGRRSRPTCTRSTSKAAACACCSAWATSQTLAARARGRASTPSSSTASRRRRTRDVVRAPVQAALARLAAPGATAATWSAARIVRDGLARAGFRSRRPRRRRQARDHGRPLRAALRAARARRPGARARPQRARRSIVGAGLAGAAAVRALARRAWPAPCSTRSRDAATQASGNPGRACSTASSAPTTRLHARCNRAAACTRPACAARTPRLRRWSGLLRLHGALDIDAMRSLLQLQRLPERYVQALDAAQATARAGLALAQPAWCFADGGWADPAALVRATAGRCATCVGEATAPVHSVQAVAGGWRVVAADGQTLGEAPLVVLADGHEALRLAALPGAWASRARGQVSAGCTARTPRRACRWPAAAMR